MARVGADRAAAGSSAPARPLNRACVRAPLAQDIRQAVGLMADPGIGADDWGWADPDPGRTAQEAIAEMGEEMVSSDVKLRGDLTGTSKGAELYGERYGEGPSWEANGGTRAFRYEGIPRWQDLSRGKNYDRDIEETLGRGDRELGNQVRRWDMAPAVEPRGEETRRYGPRD